MNEIEHREIVRWKGVPTNDYDLYWSRRRAKRLGIKYEPIKYEPWNMISGDWGVFCKKKRQDSRKWDNCLLLVGYVDGELYGVEEYLETRDVTSRLCYKRGAPRHGGSLNLRGFKDYLKENRLKYVRGAPCVVGQNEDYDNIILETPMLSTGQTWGINSAVCFMKNNNPELYKMFHPDEHGDKK